MRDAAGPAPRSQPSFATAFFSSRRDSPDSRDAYEANERARARAASRDDEVARLEAAARAAETRVEKVTEALAQMQLGATGGEAPRRGGEAPGSPRGARAAAATAKPAPLPRAYSGRVVLAVLEHIGAAALAKPQKAKALLHGIVEAILMQPTADGCAVRMTQKKTGPAVLSDGGAGDSQTGCGGSATALASSARARSAARYFSVARSASS